MQVHKTIAVGWGGGKDSTYALHRLKVVDGRDVACLVAIAQDKDPQVWIHGYAHSLLERQCEFLGIPLLTLWFSKGRTYRDLMAEMAQALKDQGVDTVAYGDISCAAIRVERLRLHQESGMQCCLPLWGMDTQAVAMQFLAAGYKAIVTCVSLDHLDPSYCGRDFDERFLEDLPAGVDRCGENGEFHTFAYDGPLFSRPVPFTRPPVEVCECDTAGRKLRFAFCRAH